MSFDQRNPLNYDLLHFVDPNALSTFQKGIDPDRKLNKVQVVIKDTNVRKFYWKNFVKDLEQVNNSEKLYLELLNIYKKFQSTGVYKGVGISFEPDQTTGEMKLIFSPQYNRKFNYALESRSLETISFPSYGLNGGFLIKNLAGIMDTAYLGAHLGLNGKPRYGYYLAYSVPSVYKNYSVEVKFLKENKGINRFVKEKSQLQMISIIPPDTNATKFQIINVLRSNLIDPIHHSKEILEQELEPTRKLSIVAIKPFINVQIDRPWSNALYIGGELASVEKAGKFARIWMQNNYITSPEFIRQKGRLSQIVFQNKTLFGVLFPFSRNKVLINDKFHSLPMRGFSDVINPEGTFDSSLHPQSGRPGFEFLGDSKGDDLFLQNTSKILFKESPIFKFAGIDPFLYLSYGYFSGDVASQWFKPRTTETPEAQSVNKRNRKWIEDIKKKSRISLGVGIQRAFGDCVLEAVINLYTVGTPSDKYQTFQFRCAFND